MSEEVIKVEPPVIEHGYVQEVEKVEEPVKEEAPKQEPINYFAKLVKPHLKVSRDVTEEDLPRVIEDAKTLYNLCYTYCGIYPGAHAMHHSQIDDKDPLNFFVTAAQEIVINPVITRHSNYTVDSEEGCITFFDKPEKIVQRYHKIEADYKTLTAEGKLTDVLKVKLTGKISKIFQHELQHSGNYGYPYIHEYAQSE